VRAPLLTKVSLIDKGFGVIRLSNTNLCRGICKWHNSYRRIEYLLCTSFDAEGCDGNDCKTPCQECFRLEVPEQHHRTPRPTACVVEKLQVVEFARRPVVIPLELTDA